jgi:hypothetical protein
MRPHDLVGHFREDRPRTAVEPTDSFCRLLVSVLFAVKFLNVNAGGRHFFGRGFH